MLAYRDLLRRNPDYARLWAAQAISLLGDWFNTIVLFALVTSYSPEESQGLAISGLLLARFLPPLLVSPLSGVLADRFDRKRLLVISDVLRAMIVLSFLLVTSPDRLWIVYVFTVLQFSLSAIFEPARNAITPSLCSKDDLVLANMLGSVTWSVMLAAGAAIGGLVAGVVGVSLALVIDSLSFVLSAVIILQIRTRIIAVPVASVTEAVPKATFAQGLRYIAANPATALALLIKFGGNLGNIDLLMTVYATHYFVIGKDGTGSLGILWSAFGIGAIIGPVILNRFNDGTVRRMRRLIIVGYAWIALGWLLLGAAPSLATAALAVMVKAAGSSIYWTYSSVILQKSVENDYLGRMFSMDLAGAQLSTVLSVIVVGALFDTMGAENGRLIAYGTVIVSLIPLALWTLAIPWLERREVVPATSA